MYLTSFKCGGIIFDIHDSDRLSKDDGISDYFICPKLIFKLEAWLIRMNKEKIKTKEEMEFLIKEGFLGTYV